MTGEQTREDAAGLDYLYEDQQQREIEYEPDYGND
jgi:hypothetical protein